MSSVACDLQTVCLPVSRVTCSVLLLQHKPSTFQELYSAENRPQPPRVPLRLFWVPGRRAAAIPSPAATGLVHSDAILAAAAPEAWDARGSGAAAPSGRGAERACPRHSSRQTPAPT